MRIARPKKKRSRAKLNDAAMLQLSMRQGGRCAICAFQLEYSDMHVDHIVPFSIGGTNRLHNLRLVHRSCNLSRGDRL